MSFPLTNMLLARAKSLDLIVSNDDVLSYFDNRTGGGETITASSEYLTGIYQEPDLGTYAGNINDLTEQQITDLANGVAFGAVAWSTLEKAWILENLEVSSGDSTKRYGFTFTSYDSGVLNIPVTNAGARGNWGSLEQAIFDGDELPPDFVPGSLPILQGSSDIGDWYNLEPLSNGGGEGTTDWEGTPDDWTVTGTATTGSQAIVTGNGFNGNAFKINIISGNNWRTYCNVNLSGFSTKAVIRFKYRSDVGFELSARTSSGTEKIADVPINTSNAYTAYYYYTGTLGDFQSLEFKLTSVGYLEIDEVEASNPESVPDDWTSTVFGTTTTEVLTPVGFFRNAIELTLSGVGVNGLSSDIEIALDSAENYLISFRYKGTGLEVALGGAVYHSVPTNTGDPAIYQVQLTAGLSLFTPQFRTLLDGGGFTIDEIELIQI